MLRIVELAKRKTRLDSQRRGRCGAGASGPPHSLSQRGPFGLVLASNETSTHSHGKRTAATFETTTAICKSKLTPDSTVGVPRSPARRLQSTDPKRELAGIFVVDARAVPDDGREMLGRSKTTVAANGELLFQDSNRRVVAFTHRSLQRSTLCCPRRRRTSHISYALRLQGRRTRTKECECRIPHKLGGAP